jgi:hypothetical protein
VNSETHSLFGTHNDDIPPTADNSAHFFRHSLFHEKQNALKPFDFPLLRVPSEYRLIRHKACRSNSKRKEDGTVLKEATEVQMPANSILRVEGDSRGIKILCRNLKDYLLGNKGDFTINRDGLVVVQALTDTEIVVSPEIERDSVKKQQ